MTNLYQQWRDIAEAERTQEAGEKFWNDYFEAETENYKKLLAEKSDLAVYEAVKGMLPKNSLGRTMLKKLRVYKGAEHNHAAQKPEELKVD